MTGAAQQNSRTCCVATTKPLILARFFLFAHCM